VNIDKYISELLYGHDCVIIPDFGGFVANYSPARIHPTQHTFSPPSKDIVFNKNLKSNDGLLANAIATSEQVSYAEAGRRIAAYVEDCMKSLRSGKRFNINSVGTLYYDVERNLQFEPDRTVNYLTDAFGLTTFQSPAIRRDNLHRHVQKEFRDREPLPAPARKRINVKKYVALALGGAAIVFAALWIPLKTDLLKSSGNASFNIFSSKEAGKYEVRKASVGLISMDDFIEDPAAPASTTYITGPAPATETSPPVADPESTAVADPVSQAITNGSYHIVAGCFMVQENAHRFVQQLSEKNVAASIVGQNKAGLYVVSVGSYSSREEALINLSSARALSPEAWLYEN
jgi:hypothetical protein